MMRQSFSRYEIRSELGRGGMATVYLAHDPYVRRDVALKVLPREYLHDPTFRTRFQREAQLVAALEHPAIVPIYDFGEENGQPFLVMRHMHGGSLADRLAHGPLPFPEVVRVIQRLASGLDRAHQQGIIHRDLKPANILFDQYRDAFLSDFGIAKLASETSGRLTSANQVVGTLAYMSPEQAQGMKLDRRSDIYTLGTVLFQMLTGRLPFESETPMGMAVKHITETVPNVHRLRPGLPAGVETIIAKAMAKDPAQRYQVAGHMAHDLAALLPGPSSPYPYPAPVISTASTPPEPQTAPLPVAPAVRSGQEAKRGIPTWLWLGGSVLALVIVVALLAGGAFALNQMGLLGGDSPAASAETAVSTPPAGSGETDEQMPVAVDTTETPAAGEQAPPTPAAATETPTVPPLDELPLITTENAGDVVNIGRLGRGSIHALAYSPDGSRYAVSGGLGV